MHTTVDTFTCDTCGDIEQVPVGTVPKGWRKHKSGPITTVDAKGGTAVGDGEEEDWEVCGSCHTNVKRALAPKNDRVRTIQAAAGVMPGE